MFIIACLCPLCQKVSFTGYKIHAFSFSSQLLEFSLSWSLQWECICTDNYGKKRVKAVAISPVNNQHMSLTTAVAKTVNHFSPMGAYFLQHHHSVNQPGSSPSPQNTSWIAEWSTFQSLFSFLSIVMFVLHITQALQNEKHSLSRKNHYFNSNKISYEVLGIGRIFLPLLYIIKEYYILYNIVRT